MVFTTDGLISWTDELSWQSDYELLVKLSYIIDTSGQLSNAGSSEVCRAAGIQAALRLIDTWLILPVEYAYLKD